MKTVLIIIFSIIIAIMMLVLLATILAKPARRYAERNLCSEDLPKRNIKPYLLIKRVLDIIISASAIIALFPLALLISVCIFLEDGGPVIYRPRRMRPDGKIIRVYKFRSMVVDPEKASYRQRGNGIDDPRITRIGHIIRYSGLDELPMLLNILKGDISFVGVHLNFPDYNYKLESEGGNYIYKARAGLITPSKLFLPLLSGIEARAKLSRAYEARCSLLLDLALICCTITQIITPVDEDETTV